MTTPLPPYVFDKKSRDGAKLRRALAKLVAAAKKAAWWSMFPTPGDHQYAKLDEQALYRQAQKFYVLQREIEVRRSEGDRR